jgi:signal peptidase I
MTLFKHNTISKAPKKKETLRESITSITVAIAIALLIRTFLFQPFVIPSGSMKPTLLIGDFLFVSKFSYGFTKHSLPFSLPLIPGKIMERGKPKIGDVVVFRGPYDPGTDYIKRVVGTPGDRVQVKEGILYINDTPCPVEAEGSFTDDLWTKRHGREEERMLEPRVIDRYIETLPGGIKHEILKLDRFGQGSLDNTEAFIVPAGHYFMMGDNRDESGDSRVQSQIGFVPEDHIIGKAQIIWFSTTARWWEVWKWPFDIRFKRLFQSIN